MAQGGQFSVAHDSFSIDVQPRAPRGGVRKNPDYALFLSEDDRRFCRQHRNEPAQYYSRVPAILEAKAWGRPLNDTIRRDVDPTAQTVRYLDDVYGLSHGHVQWAILTNGKMWRLFYYHSGFMAGTFYDVDLESAVDSGDLDTFKYFYLFFSSTALRPDPITAASLLDQHVKGSQEYATAVSGELKELVFDRVFEDLAQGFVEARQTDKSSVEMSEIELKEVFDGCLVLLYRLLFLLYAESRNLLPIGESGYRKKSLSQIRDDIAEELATTPRDRMSRRSYVYWGRFESLCGVVAAGDRELNVPMYNGGLFEDREGSFLQRHHLADYYFVRAIEALTFSAEHGKQGRPSFIDYSSLSVRHLGDIYEGLLEFTIRVAEVPMVAVTEKGRCIWRRESEVRDRAPVARREPGHTYIENSNHERRSTGSYFTRDFVVGFMVKYTVGPVLEERLKRAETLMHSCMNGTKGKRTPRSEALENELFETLFGIKVLDLTMGSAHFLVETVNYIANRLVIFLARFEHNPVIARIDQMRKQIVKDVVERQGVEIDQSRLTEVNLIKRMVMKRCIFGVDINSMAVELAKLSLWLDSFTLGAPLSFLNHHIKRGNSLVGKDDVARAIIGGGQSQTFRDALKSAAEISLSPDATAQDVLNDKRLFGHLEEQLEPYRRRLSFQIAGDLVRMKSSDPLRVEEAVQRGTLDGVSKEGRSDARQAAELANEHMFFHWRLEFPELFYDEHGELEEPGVDVVIGNPPYVRQEWLKPLKKYFAANYSAFGSTADLYVAFIEKGLRMVKPGGLFGMIVSNKWIRADYGEGLRALLVNKATPVTLLSFAGLPVFPDATVRTVVLLCTPKPGQAATVAYVPASSKQKFDTLKTGDDVETLLAGRIAVPMRQLTPAWWSLTDSKTHSILEKLVDRGQALNTYIHDKPYFGVKTGLNEAFILTKRQRDELLATDPSSAAIIKPVLEGENVRRYHCDFANRYLVWTYVGVPMKDYPAVLSYLAKFKGRLEKRQDQGDHWWELRHCAYYGKIAAPKIIFPDMALNCRFALDDVGYFGTNTTYFLPTDDRYLLGVLNSRVAQFYFSHRCAELEGSGSSYLRFFGQTMEEFPVPQAGKSASSRRSHVRLVELVNQMLVLHRRLATDGFNPDRARLEHEIDDVDHAIDALVYGIYGLSEEEIAIVEGRTK